MIKVSVIIPVYNVDKYISRCLNSLISQTLKDIEIIVINDGSTDNSKKIIDEYKKNHKNIRVINTKNNGIGPARNLGIEKAKGTYICFVDGDDYLDEKALELAFNNIKESNSDIVVYDTVDVSESGKVINEEVIKFFKTKPLKEEKELLYLINPGPCNKLYKKELFSNIKFPNDKTKYEDLMTITKVLTQAKNISKLDEKLYYYVIREEGETKTVDKRVFDIIKVLSNINDYFKEKNIYDEYYLELMYLNIKHIMFQVLKQRYSKDKTTSMKFIDEAYTFLDKNFPEWKKNPYYKRESITKRLVKNNRFLLKIYFKIYNWR